ncbi:hypothetical protein HHK36_004245 [Tetracentron sinense]|uniref:Chlororespiratory reduction 4 n=1 Tax=Tetracentron sinense TaxID=13715 RepID=A0A834ZSI7_TETSI|nr:hypothetical protein HHK36_004245 [Tetracentron sinense]
MEQKMLQILQNCKSIRELKQTHLQIFIHGLQDSNFVLPKLISLSSTFHSLDYAVQIFENSHHRNVFVYNTMIECFIGRNCRKDAFHIFNRMNASSIASNSFTITFLLRSCESFEALKDGNQIHTHTVKSGFGSSVFVQNTLLDFYSKCSGNIDSACRVFEEMLERDVISWNSMIGAYMARGETESAIHLFDSMPEKNVVSWNSIITGLSKAGNMESAHLVFQRMTKRNEVSWNAMISGYMRKGDVINARSIFDEMPEKSVVSWTAMITGYANIGDLTSASDLFNRMPIKNVVSWNAMIAGYVHNHLFDQALCVFHHMLINGECRPNEATLISILCACSHLGNLENGKWIDSYIKKNKIELSISLGNALVDMLAKCGDVENAKAVFHRMTRRNIITWTTMVSGLAMNGQCGEALALFDTMCREGIEPDDVIFISVLSACNHGGLVEEGRRVFDQMRREFNIKPRIEHYGCMVDLLGRAGKLEEAVKFITSMPLEPNAVIWATLLGSCKTYRNEELLELVTRMILDQEPSNPGYLMQISNLNASVGRWEDALSIRAAMKQEGIEKVPGCSSIQIRNRVHEFIARDTRHAQRKKIYGTLDSLHEHLRVVGDVPSNATVVYEP